MGNYRNGPNRVLANSERKLVKVAEVNCGSDRTKASTTKQDYRDLGYTNVRITNYNLGPRSKPTKQYVVHVYQNNDSN